MERQMEKLGQNTGEQESWRNDDEDNDAISA